MQPTNSRPSTAPPPPKRAKDYTSWRPPPPKAPSINRPLTRRPVLVTPHAFSHIVFFAVISVVALMGWAYLGSLRPVLIVAGGKETTIWTHQATVRGALTEAGYVWSQEDVFQPALDARLPSDGKVVVHSAMPVMVESDGNIVKRLTQGATVGAVLKEIGVQLKPSDRVYLNGRVVPPRTNLPRNTRTLGSNSSSPASLQYASLIVERGIPISINDNGLVSTVYTTAPTLGSALSDSGVLVYLGDYVSPDLGSPVSSGESVFIRRSRAASITVDGRVIKTRTRALNVAELLAQEGLELEGKDFTAPTPTSQVVDGIKVEITRVRELYVTETQSIAFETHWLPNPDMEIDTRSSPQNGSKGIKNRLIKSVYENGKLISQGLEREWIAKAPQDKIINYGTKIIVRDLPLPNGSVVQYWRTLRMLATSYTAATSGKARTNPQYGRTFIGLTAGLGVVAVDPRVINLRSNVYIPNYGPALAGDTGGGIKGRRVDLGFPDTNLQDWYRWVNVYILAPVPPLSQVNYVVSDYPQEPARNER